jgi:hypothetical protein
MAYGTARYSSYAAALETPQTGGAAAA